MTRIYTCPHCQNRFRGVSKAWIRDHEDDCWPEDSPWL